MAAADQLLRTVAVTDTGYLPDITPAAWEALDLHRRGLNVFPQPFACKSGYPWLAVQYIRLAEDDLPALFAYRCNVAVMTGRTSGYLFAIDCETPQAWKDQRARLQAVGVAPWSYHSARGGHLWLRSADGEVRNVPVTSSGLDLEIRGNRNYILAPPSVHPTGVFYEWHERSGEGPPVVPLSLLSWLPLKPIVTGGASTSASARVGVTENPQAALEAQARRVASAPEGTRNNTLNRAAFTLGPLVAAGALDYDEVTDTLYEAAHQAGLSRGEILPTIRSGLNAGLSKGRLTQPNDLPERLRAWISHHTWYTGAGASRRAVALALAECARNACNDVWRASVRELATLARVDFKTALKALSYLLDTGYVARAGADRTSKATLWKPGAKLTISATLSAPPALPGAVPPAADGDARTPGAADQQKSDIVPPLSPIGSKSGGVLSLLPATDAAERGALGKNGYLVYRALLASPEPLRAQQVATALGLTLRQTRYALRVLYEAGQDSGVALIEPVGRAWVANPVNDEWLDRLVAFACGTAGKGEARRARFARERQGRAAELFMRAIVRQRAKERSIRPGNGPGVSSKKEMDDGNQQSERLLGLRRRAP